MNPVQTVPPQLEENLACAIEKLVMRRKFVGNFRSMLCEVCVTANLEPDYYRVVMNSRWIEEFRRRWAHKFTSFNDTFGDFVEAGSHQRCSITELGQSEPQPGMNQKSRNGGYCTDIQANPLVDFYLESDDCSTDDDSILYDKDPCEYVQRNLMHTKRSLSINEPQIVISDSSDEDCSGTSKNVRITRSTKRRKKGTIDDEDIEVLSVSSDGFVNQLKCSKGGKKRNIAKVRCGELELEDMCIACGCTDNIDAKHPLFIGGLCKEHKFLFHEKFFEYDSDGYHSYCSICCMGRKVVLCDVQDCGRSFCRDCLTSFVNPEFFDDAAKSGYWECNFCCPSQTTLLRKRLEWQEEIQALYENNKESTFPPFLVPQPIEVESRRPIRVLSLFDGIATGMVALKQLGLEIEKFVASEIEEDAIRLVQNKHPEVIHIGDITKLSDDEIYRMGPFDLLLGGSPCNDLSGANPRRRGLLDAEGTGCLFFDFYRVLRTIEPPRDAISHRYQRPFFWLFENVVSMKGIEKRRISRFLQCEPRMADARLVSAAARPRLFWGNLPGLRDRKIAPSSTDRLTVQECLEYGRTARVEKLNTITTKFTCLYQGQSRRAPVRHNDKEDVLWTTEVERVFGVPEHYTDVNNLGPRERLALLGRSWSIPVVRLLLSPLKEYFAGVQPKIKKERLLPNSKWWN